MINRTTTIKNQKKEIQRLRQEIRRLKDRLKYIELKIFQIGYGIDSYEAISKIKEVLN